MIIRYPNVQRKDIGDTLLDMAQVPKSNCLPPAAPRELLLTTTTHLRPNPHKKPLSSSRDHLRSSQVYFKCISSHSLIRHVKQFDAFKTTQILLLKPCSRAGEGPSPSSSKASGGSSLRTCCSRRGALAGLPEFLQQSLLFQGLLCSLFPFLLFLLCFASFSVSDTVFLVVENVHFLLQDFPSQLPVLIQGPRLMALREGEEVRDPRTAGWFSGPQDSAHATSSLQRGRAREARTLGKNPSEGVTKPGRVPGPHPCRMWLSQRLFLVGSVVLFSSNSSL